MKKRNIIVLGDRTTHGGTVISAWGQDGGVPMTINGKPVACVGDYVYCPKCRGTHQIIEGAENPPMYLNGRQVALEGCRVSDNSQLLSAGQDIAWHTSEGDGAAEAVTAYGSGSPDRVVSLNDPDPGGFVKAGLFGSSPPRMSDRVFEANMCEWACDCKDKYGKNGTHQGCVDGKIRAQYYDSTDHPKDGSPVWSEVSYRKYDDSPFNNPQSFKQYDLVESENYPGKPTSWYPRSDTWRLDVVKIGANGKPEKFYDMKFPGDKPDQNWAKRKEEYKAIAKKHTGSKSNYVTFDVEKKCDCMKQDKEQPQTQPQREPEKSLFDKFKEMFKPGEKPIEEQLPPEYGGKKPRPPSSPPVVLPPLPGMPPIRPDMPLIKL